MIRPVGQLETVGEQEFGIGRLQMGRQFPQFAPKHQPGARGVQFQARLMAPAGQPLQQLAAGQQQGSAELRAPAVDFGQPSDELPVFRGKELLFVGRARGQLDDLGERADLLACAWTGEDQLDA